MKSIVYLSTKQITVEGTHPIKEMEDTTFELLKKSIQEYGIRYPICVCPNSDGKYNIIDGRHRLKAALALGHETIPCIIIERDPSEIIGTQYYAELIRKSYTDNEISEFLQKAQKEKASLIEHLISEIVNKTGLAESLVRQQITNKNDLIRLINLINTYNPSFRDKKAEDELNETIYNLQSEITKKEKKIKELEEEKTIWVRNQQSKIKEEIEKRINEEVKKRLELLNTSTTTDDVYEHIDVERLKEEIKQEVENQYYEKIKEYEHNLEEDKKRIVELTHELKKLRERYDPVEVEKKKLEQSLDDFKLQLEQARALIFKKDESLKKVSVFSSIEAKYNYIINELNMLSTMLINYGNIGADKNKISEFKNSLSKIEQHVIALQSICEQILSKE